jgi:hypothetical protein
MSAMAIYQKPEGVRTGGTEYALCWPLGPEQSAGSEPRRKEAEQSSAAKSPATTFSANPE